METSQFDLFSSSSSSSAAETQDDRFARSAPRPGEQPLVALAGGAICLVGSENDRRAAWRAKAPSQECCEVTAQPMSVAQHQALFATIGSEESTVSPDTVRDAFERLVRDRELVLAELGKLTVNELLARLHGEYVHDRRKPALLERAYDSMLTSYLFLMATSAVISIRDVTQSGRILTIRNKLAGLGESHLEAYRVRVTEAREARRARLQATVEAIKDPKNLADFKTFIEINGKESLTSEQSARYEDLLAEAMFDRAAVVSAPRPSVPDLSDGRIDMELVETRHTREGYELFVVKLNSRVANEQFNALRDRAKACGGWYSSFRRDGAVPGFQFKVKANAQQFLGEPQLAASAEARKALDGTGQGGAQGVAPEESTPSKQVAGAPRQSLGAAQKLRAQAAKLREWSALSMGRRRLTNTPRRARMATYADEIARKDAALADTLDNLATAIAGGRCKFLALVTEKIQVVELSDMILAAKHREFLATSAGTRDFESRKTEKPTIATVAYVDYPLFKGSREQLTELAEKIADEPGLKRSAATVSKIAATAGDSRSDVPVPNELATSILDKLPKKDSRVPWQWPVVAEKQKRLQRMGVTCVEQLRAACRELLQYQGHVGQADAATELERQLVGSKVGVDFFPTPKALAKRMVDIATERLAPGARVLEPQAGNGNIAEVLRDAGFEPDVVEISSSLRDILSAKGFKIVGNDFLEVQETYDAIVMNPPFGNGADIVHVQHAWSLLAPGGHLVSIVGEGAFNRSDRAAVAFRDWLDEVGGTQERLPADTFMDRSLLVTTSANARLVTIHRP